MKRFKEGDVVRKKTGGPKMTIEEISKSGIFNCAWFVNSLLFRGQFLHESLVKA